jgi:hypothetical protein
MTQQSANSINTLHMNNLPDEFLVKMFYNLRIERNSEKKLIYEILRIMASRNKLDLIMSNQL